MGLANKAGLASANTTFVARFSEVYAGGPMGIVAPFTEVIPVDGTSIEIDVIASYPRARQWLGAKQSKDVRAYTQTVTLTKYEATIAFDRLDVDNDKSGVVSRGINGFVDSQAYWYDDILLAKLVANTWTGHDGVTLLNSSHPNSNSTGNNISTTALSFAQKKAAVQAMELFTDEDGKPLGCYPTDLIVGPQLRQTGMEVTGSDRLVGIDSSGAFDQTSSVVGVSKLTNYVGGDINLHVSPWLTGTQYFFVDRSKPAKPFIMAESRAPEAIEITDMNAHERFFEDKYHFSIEADIAPAAGMWQCVYGKVTA